MNILFLHPNFPGQQVHLAYHFAHTGENRVVFLSQSDDKGRIAGVERIVYKLQREVDREHCHPYLLSAEEAVLTGQAVFRAAYELKKSGFTPDIITGHTGWGSLLYLKELFPTTPLLGYFEWFYHSHGSDASYWPNEVISDDSSCQIYSKNLHHLLSLETCDAGYCPMQWQKAQFPAVYRPKLDVIHDGISTDLLIPKTGAKLVLKEQKLDLSQAKEVVTYVSRGFEPYRGFPQFIAATRQLLEARPECHVVIVGSDQAFYGGKAPDGKTWKEYVLERSGELDAKRVHFTGPLARTQYLQVLQASTVHVYLTRPFILSWSMLEAMSAGCCMVVSNTPPVREVVEDGVNGLLADFRSPSHIADRIEEALEDAALRRRLSACARETIVERYDVKKMVRRQIQFIYKHIE